MSRHELTRRRFLELAAGSTAALAMAGCVELDDGKVESPLPEGPTGDQPDLTGVEYPRGPEPVFEPSPVAPADPGAVDGGQLVDLIPSAVALDEARFGYGVQAGMMAHDAVELWTRVADDAPVRLRVWRETDAPGQVALVFDEVVAPMPDADGCVRHRVEGLAAGTVYRYAFFRHDTLDAPRSEQEATAEPLALRGRSAVGRVRTAFLPEGVGPLTIAATTCTNEEAGAFTSLELLAEAEADIFLHLGDFAYDEAETLEQYRAKWNKALRDGPTQRVLQSTGMVMSWDDHDVANDFNFESIDPVRLELARKAYAEHLPVYREGKRLWTSYRWGHTAEFFVLDARSEVRPSTRLTRDATFISREQLDWLEQALRDSPARFKLVLNSVPMTNLQGPRARTYLEQRWGGYLAQRQELLDFITDNDIRDVWFLSGDMHLGFISRLDWRGAPARLWELAVGPGAVAEPNDFVRDVDAGLLPADQIYPPAMYRYWSAAQKVATLLTLDPVRGTIRARYIDADAREVLFDEELHQLD